MLAHHELDFDALHATSTRIVVAAGAESEGELAKSGGVRGRGAPWHPGSGLPEYHGGFVGG